jgi:hypothetical protein
MPATTVSDVHSALESQVDVYVDAGYPALAGLTTDAFRELASVAVASAASRDVPAGEGPGLTALLVVTSAFVAPEIRVPLLRLPGSTKPGIVDKNHDSDARKGLAHYVPRPELRVPDAPMYVALGIKRGDEFRDVAPRDALPVIAGRGRSPLTIDEGISLATVAPELLVKNRCFMLAGSTRGDKRVPALWIADGAPKLGWCFEGVPHSWLGVASAAARVGDAL